MSWTFITYKLKYINRKFWRLLGLCEKCHQRLNYTRSGRGICNNIYCN